MVAALRPTICSMCGGKTITPYSSQSRGAGPASGRDSWSASSRRALRWSSASTGVPRKTNLRTTITMSTLRGARCARLDPVRRSEPEPPDGMRTLDGGTHPLAPSRERAPASRLCHCAAAQSQGPCRGPRRITRCAEPRGEAFLMEPLPRPRKTSPRLPRTRSRAFAWDRSPCGFRIADHASSAHRKRRFQWLSDSVTRIPPASTTDNHLSLAGSGRSRVRGRPGSWCGERLETEVPGRPARCRTASGPRGAAR